MSVNIKQSKIAEVRDQLSLDFADGKYLDVVASNLGLTRPPFGFDDDTWRAIVKAISLQHKQIRTKFEEILSIIFGPKVTQCSSFAEPVYAGDKHAVLVGTIQFPQVGTMVIDEGLPTEETVRYCYIDRYSNTVYFETPLLFNHLAINAEWESGVIGPVQATEITRTVFDTSGYPDPNTGPYTVNIGRGTPYEYVDVMSTVVYAPGRLVAFTYGSANPNPGFSTVPGNVKYTGPITTQANAYYVGMQNVDDLKVENGHLSSPVLKTASHVVTAAGLNSITIPSATDFAYCGYLVQFSGNVTPALTNVIGHVAFNFANTLYFYNSIPAAAPGDTFSFIAPFQYIRSTSADDTVLMRQELPDLNVINAGTPVDVIEPVTTVAIAQVQVKAGGWDIFESDPDHVEILFPRDFLHFDPRSASYIRRVDGFGISSADAVRAIGDVDASVISTSGMPVIGVLEHVQGGPVRYAYWNPHAWITAEAATGATQITVTDTSLFPSTGILRINGVIVGAYTVVDLTTITVPPLPFDVERGMFIRDEKIWLFAKPLTAPIAITDDLNWYTNYEYGDLWDLDDVWPGPYIYDLFRQVHKQQTVPNVTSTAFWSGTTKLSVDRVAGNSVFELENGSAIDIPVPFDIKIGENSGNVETLSVQEFSLKSRTYTTLLNAAPIGSLSLDVTALSGPLGPWNTFPNAGPYRVVIWTSPTSAEVVEVIGTDLGPPNRLNLSFPTTQNHGIGARVVLLSDLINVSPASIDDHLGVVSSVNRFDFYARETQSSSADLARPLYSQISLTSTADFNLVGGTGVFNFGKASLNVTNELSAVALTGSGTLTLADSTGFPTSGYPYIVTVGVGQGPLYEDRLYVTNNNTGTGTLTLSHPTRWDYLVGAKVSFESGPEENFSYNSVSGSDLTFSSYLEVANTHQIIEEVAPTVGTGYPRTNGFDFPLRLPISIEDLLRSIVDLVRAAGVLVTFISKR